MVIQFLTRLFRSFPGLKGFLWEKGYDLLSDYISATLEVPHFFLKFPAELISMYDAP